MDNLYRELAPISAGAWDQIEDEARRTLKRYLGARRVVDLHGPEGYALSAVGTGHVTSAPALAEGVECARREVSQLVELRVPFQLSRSAIDDVARSNEYPIADMKGRANSFFPVGINDGNERNRAGRADVTFLDGALLGHRKSLSTRRRPITNFANIAVHSQMRTSGIRSNPFGCCRSRDSTPTERVLNTH